MRIIDFFRDIFQPGKTYQLNQRLTDEKRRKLDIETFFTYMAINLIAGTVAKCEFKTFLKGKPVQGDEYYLWNYEPNFNQNSSEFVQELVTKLLYRNEVLIFELNGQLLIADSFCRTQYALYPDTFSSVICKNLTLTTTFNAGDVIYLRLGQDNIRMHLSRLMDGYADLLDMAVGKYKRAGGRKGIAKTKRTKTGDEKLQKQIDDLFNEQFRTYFEAENAVIDLPDGIEYEEKTGDGSKKSTSEVADIQLIEKEAVARVAQAFRIPPALLQGDIAEVGTITDNYLTFCIDPLVDLIQTEINRKRYGKAGVLADSYLKIDATCIRHIDIFGAAVQVDKLLADGLYSIDELRGKMGDTPLNTDFSGKHWITSNYNEITAGGEKANEQTGENNLGGENAGGSA